MDESSTLAEGVGARAKKDPLPGTGPTPGAFVEKSVPNGTQEPELNHFLVRWDRKAAAGDKVKWYPVYAANSHDAAKFFATSCDVGNPRPPARRVAVVRLLQSDEETKVVVASLPTIQYEAQTVS